MATAKKLPSGSYRVKAYIGKGADGKPQYKSFTAKTKKEAEYAAAEYLQKTEKQRCDAARNHITFEAALERYIIEREPVVSPSTMLGYRSLQKNAYATINKTYIDEITQHDITAAVNAYAEGHTPKTVRNMHGLLCAVIGADRPEFQIKTVLPQKEKKRVLVPSEAEIKTLFADVKDTPLEIPFLLASTLGLRESEISGLEVDCIYPNDERIHIKQARVASAEGTTIKQPKSYAGDRILPCNKELCERMIAGAENGFVTPLSGRQIADRWHKVVTSAGTRRITFHALRHYFASKALLQGIPKEYLVELMGHGSSKMLDEVYLHTFPDAKEHFAMMLLQPQEELYSTKYATEAD